MAKYRLLSGHHSRYEDGDLLRYEPGSELELSEAELAAFADKFELVGGGNPKPAFAPLSVKATLAAVKAGKLSAGEALAAELASETPRKSLVGELKKLA